MLRDKGYGVTGTLIETVKEIPDSNERCGGSLVEEMARDLYGIR